MNENITTIFNTVKEALDNAVGAINTAQKALFAQANTEKSNLLLLLSEMAETRKAIRELGTLSAEAGSMLVDIDEGCTHVSSKIGYITDAVDEVPLTDYEKFIDFCDECGNVICVGEEYRHEGADWYVCAECLRKEREAAEAAAPVEEA